MATEEPIMASVAGRYATALFDLASEQGQVAQVERDIIRFQELLAGSEDLRRLVRSPAFSAGDQTRAVGAVLDKAGIGGLAGNFLRVIARNRRLFAVHDTIRAFRALAARARGEVQAEVTSAVPLSQAQLDALKDSLRAAIGGKEVQLETHVDPALLGGLVVKMGSRMVDSSLRTKLATLKTRMKEVR